jgi:hypothetical protein
MPLATFFTLSDHVKVSLYFFGHSSTTSAGNHCVPAGVPPFLEIFSTSQRKSALFPLFLT